MAAQAHTACLSLMPQRPAHLIPHKQGILADAFSQWPTLDRGPCTLFPAAVGEAWMAVLAPVYDKPRHSHWLWFPEAGCLAVRWQMLTHTVSDTDCKHAYTLAIQNLLNQEALKYDPNHLKGISIIVREVLASHVSLSDSKPCPVSGCGLEL